METGSGGDRPLAIGRTLEGARKRAGLEIGDVQDETKIRGKFLKALEEERWEALPGPAYIRGFLRTYAELVGLDGEALVDEYRRRFERPRAGQPMAFAEPVLKEQHPEPGHERRLAGRPMPWVVAAGALVALLVLGLTAGGDEQSSERPSGKQSRKPQSDQGARRSDRPGRQFTLRLVTRTDVEVCLMDAEGRPLIDNQVLVAGREEKFAGKRFRLTLGPGRVRVFIDGKRRRTSASQQPVSYRITAAGPEPRPYAGRDCPPEPDGEGSPAAAAPISPST